MSASARNDQDDADRAALRELWLRRLHGETLPDDQERRLAQALAADPGLREDCLADAALDGVLQALPAIRAGDGFAEGLLQRLAAERTGTAFVRRVVERSASSSRRRAQRRPARRGGAGWWAVAAALVAVVGLALADRLATARERPSATPAAEALATVEALDGAVRRRQAGTDAALARGAGLRRGDELSAGAGARATLRFHDGTLLRLDGGELALLDGQDRAGRGAGKRVALRSGRAHVEAAPQPAGAPLAIATPQADATVVGTVFDLAVEEQATRLEVSSGHVRLARRDDGAAVEVAAGQQAIAAAGRELAATPIAAPAPVIAARRWSNGFSDDPAFFPIGVWLQEPRHAAAYARAGINLYLALWNEPDTAQLDLLHQAGIGLICEPSAALLARHGHPAIVGWFLGDGPDNAQLQAGGDYGPPVAPEALVARYQAVTRADPTRPVLVDFGIGASVDGWFGRGVRSDHPEDYPRYLEGCDLCTCSVYPVTSEHAELAMKLWLPARGVARLRGWSGGRKPVWPIIECAPVGAEHAPTVAQVRAEAWMAVIEGATGIVYYVHRQREPTNDHALLDDPVLLAGVTVLDAELREAAPILHQPTEAGVTVAATPEAVPVACLAKRHGGALHLFAIATRDGAAEAVFTVPGAADGAVVEVVGEGRTLSVADGRFSDAFAPYQLHRYRIR
jgi:hypothetical protein